MKIVSIVGARPQFIKIAPFAHAITHRSKTGDIPIRHILVHTGQHYAPEMSDVFFDELDLPKVDYGLGVGSGRHGRQTGQMLTMIERVLLEVSPDIVVVFGDTNSTVAGALASVKLHIPTAHVEAGLRSFNRHMPEEINRIVADHIGDLLLAPTPTALRNLSAESLGSRAIYTGDIMYDAVLFYRQIARQRSTIGERIKLSPRQYGVVTIHRAENTDDIARLHSLLSSLNEIADSYLPLIFPMHPRTSQRIRSEFPEWKPHPRLTVIAPVGYLDMLWLIDHAAMTLTDSGGMQKEAFFLDCPCITLREETEWVETVQAGANVLAGTDVRRIRTAVARWQEWNKRKHTDVLQTLNNAFGRGNAADQILDALLQFTSSMETSPEVYVNQLASNRR